MEYNNAQYEETIDLKDLCIFILRKWRAMIIAIFAGIILLIGFKAVSSFMSDAAPEITEEQTSLAESFAQLETDIEAKQDERENTLLQIDSTEILISDTENEIDGLDDVLAVYKESLRELQAILENTVSDDNRVAIISEIASLNDSILDQTNKITVAYRNLRSYEKNISTLTDTLSTITDDLKKLQADRAAFLNENRDLIDPAGEPIPIAPESGISVNTMIKFGIIGAVLGAFAVCGCACLQYLFTKHLHNPGDLKDRFGVRILGSLYTTDDGSKKNFIDKFIDRMSGIPQQVDAKNEYSLAASEIRLLSHDAQTAIMVTGSVEMGAIEHVAGILKEMLPSEQFTVRAASNPVYDPDSMLLLKEYSVVLVESIKYSNKNEIAKLCELIRSSKSSVIGAVVL